MKLKIVMKHIITEGTEICLTQRCTKKISCKGKKPTLEQKKKNQKTIKMFLRLPFFREYV